MPVNLLGRTRHPGWGGETTTGKTYSFTCREKSEAGPNVRQAGSKRELLSLIGQLQHVSVLCDKAGKIIFENDLIVNGSKRTAPFDSVEFGFSV